MWNLKVTIIPIVIGTLGTVTKGLIKGQKDLEITRRVETTQTTALSVRILRRVRETCGQSKPSERPSAHVDVKNFQELIIMV